MSALYVRNIPDRIYKRAQALAKARGETMSAHIVRLLEADIADEENRARHRRAMRAIRRLLTERPSVPSVTDLLDDARSEREADLA